MLTSNAKRIFRDNVTCFGTNKCRSNRSHLPECFSKALRFWLAWLLCFYTENPRFFGKAIFATPPIVLAAVFFSMASSLVLFVFGHGVETSNLRDVSAQKLCQASGDFSWNKLELTYLPPARMKVTHLMSTRPNMQEAWERFKKIRSLCVVCGLLAMFRNRKWLFWDLPISVVKSTNIALWVLVMPAECWLELGLHSFGVCVHSAVGLVVRCLKTYNTSFWNAHLQMARAGICTTVSNSSYWNLGITVLENNLTEPKRWQPLCRCGRWGRHGSDSKESDVCSIVRPWLFTSAWIKSRCRGQLREWKSHSPSASCFWPWQ